MGYNNIIIPNENLIGNKVQLTIIWIFIPNCIRLWEKLPPPGKADSGVSPAELP